MDEMRWSLQPCSLAVRDADVGIHPTILVLETTAIQQAVPEGDDSEISPTSILDVT